LYGRLKKPAPQNFDQSCISSLKSCPESFRSIVKNNKY
jgi:hypothetical protein